MHAGSGGAPLATTAGSTYPLVATKGSPANFPRNPPGAGGPGANPARIALAGPTPSRCAFREASAYLPTYVRTYVPYLTYVLTYVRMYVRTEIATYVRRRSDCVQLTYVRTYVLLLLRPPPSSSVLQTPDPKPPPPLPSSRPQTLDPKHPPPPPVLQTKPKPLTQNPKLQKSETKPPELEWTQAAGTAELLAIRT